jgi:hypothetical protein
MRKAYYKTIEEANKVANEVMLKTKYVLTVLYDDKKQLYYITY